MKITVQVDDNHTNTPNQYLSGYIIDEHEIDGLVGKILTLIETLGLEQEQKESFKDLAKQLIRSSIGKHPNSFVTRNLIDLVYKFNKKLHEECIRSDAEVPDAVGASLRDGEYQLTFTSQH